MSHTPGPLKARGAFQFTSRALAEDYLFGLPYPYEADLRITGSGYVLRYWLSPTVLAAEAAIAKATGGDL